MVSLWPFKGEDNSPASFEKALATLSTKITQTTSRLDLHRQHARRFKALWTLYSSFIYLLYSVILALVLGWQNWGVKEYAAITGGPLVIYTVRAVATRYYEYRVSKTQRLLDSLQQQRDETIEKLKVATKYDSTQQLLEKYAGDSPKKSRSGVNQGPNEKRKGDGTKRKPSTGQQQQPVQRTGLPPPPTANIRRPPQQSPQSPQSPLERQQQQQQQQQIPPSPYQPQTPSPLPLPPVDEPGFAPNAFPTAPQYIEHSRWYDRLLDVLLGEDETQPKNRIVLICTTCRLVNGQAPPGVKTLEELGRWRCGSCGAWNGEESTAKKVLANIRGESLAAAAAAADAGGAWEAQSVSDDAGHPSSTGDVTDDGVMVPSEDDRVESQSSGAEALSEELEDEPQLEPEPEPVPKTTRSSKRQTRSSRASKKG